MRYFLSVLEETEIFAGTETDTAKFVQLSFWLKDGDADIGMADRDGPDSTLPGVHLWLYIPSGSVEIPKQVDDTTLNYIRYQLPEIEKFRTSGQIDARIDIEIATYHKKLFPYDTIAYRYYVIDKSGNKSNAVFTGFEILEY